MKKKTNYAGLRRRAAAFALDYLVIVAYIILLTLVSLGLQLGFTGGTADLTFLFTNPWLSDLLTFFTLILPVVLYFTFLESSRRQSSWGKQVVGLRVVRVDGSRLPVGWSFLRSLLKFLPWQIAHSSIYHISGWPLNPETPSLWVTIGLTTSMTLALFYALYLLFNANHQTPYDWVTGTVVIAKNPSTPLETGIDG